MNLFRICPSSKVVGANKLDQNLHLAFNFDTKNLYMNGFGSSDVYNLLSLCKQNVAVYVFVRLIVLHELVF